VKDRRRHLQETEGAQHGNIIVKNVAELSLSPPNRGRTKGSDPLGNAGVVDISGFGKGEKVGIRQCRDHGARGEDLRRSAREIELNLEKTQ